MKYVIDRKQEKMKLMYYDVKMDGLDVEPINNVKNLNIKAKKVKLVDKKLRESYIKQRINKKINKIISFMMRIINDDDTSEDDVGIVLDEMNRLKGIIVNKYKEYINASEYKSLLSKLIMIEDEFKKNYNNKMFTSYIQNAIYDGIKEEGRSR